MKVRVCVTSIGNREKGHGSRYIVRCFKVLNDSVFLPILVLYSLSVKSFRRLIPMLNQYSKAWKIQGARQQIRTLDAGSRHHSCDSHHD